MIGMKKKFDTVIIKKSDQAALRIFYKHMQSWQNW